MRPHVYTCQLSFIEPENLRRARDAPGGLRLGGAAVRRARETEHPSQAEVSSRTLGLDWCLKQPQVSMIEYNACLLSEAAATALAAVLGVGLSEVLAKPGES